MSSTAVPLAFAAALAVAIVGAAAPTAAQSAPLPATNPAASVEQQLGVTEIRVDYHRPRVKGRQIFGALVPWDRVWRTGSDNATRIRFSTPVTLNGAPVDSGTYELFTIPGRDEWTVILQRARSQWGAYAYDPANDAVRVAATPVRAADPVEPFTISIDGVEADRATLNIMWARTRVPVELGVDLRATAVPVLEAALRADGRRPYFQAAMFYYENRIDLDRAAELMERALEGSPGHIGMLYRLALIQEARGDVDAAIEASEASLAGARQSPQPLRDEYVRLNTLLLERLRR